MSPQQFHSRGNLQISNFFLLFQRALFCAEFTDQACFIYISAPLQDQFIRISGTALGLSHIRAVLCLAPILQALYHPKSHKMVCKIHRMLLFMLENYMFYYLGQRNIEPSECTAQVFLVSSFLTWDLSIFYILEVYKLSLQNVSKNCMFFSRIWQYCVHSMIKFSKVLAQYYGKPPESQHLGQPNRSLKL